jgi:hypothetical protein
LLPSGRGEPPTVAAVAHDGTRNASVNATGARTLMLSVEPKGLHPNRRHVNHPHVLKTGGPFVGWM